MIKSIKQLISAPKLQKLFTPSLFYHESPIIPFHSTTVLTVRKNNKMVMIADGQISQGATVFKNTAKKIRELN